MNFSFDEVRERILNKLKSKASWSEILFFSTNSRLLDSVAEAISEFAVYDEYLTRNTKWDLATEKSSLVSQAQFMQYEPHRKIGSQGKILVSAGEDFNTLPAKNIAIPKYTVFSDGQDIKFSTIQTVNLLTSDLNMEVDVVQGEPKTHVYNASGEEYEEISIESSTIENNIYELTVNGVPWTEIDDLNKSRFRSSSIFNVNFNTFNSNRINF